MHVNWQIGPLNRGQGEIEEADRSRLVGGRFNKGTYLQSLSPRAARLVGLHTCLPESSSLCRGPNGVQSRLLCTVSLNNMLLS